MDLEARARVFGGFEDGKHELIAAPRLLDEGIDVPSADLALVLASSRSRRQMIQRMGRVLRPKPDGRHARLAIFYVEGTSEDPGQTAHEGFLELILPHAEGVQTFSSAETGTQPPTAHPRCGIHDPFRSWAEYADFVDLLRRTGSIVESTQLWWSVRPHHAFGTVELRICDAQTSAAESTALEALVAACIAQAAIDHDEGVEGEPPVKVHLEMRIEGDQVTLDFSQSEVMVGPSGVSYPALLSSSFDGTLHCFPHLAPLNHGIIRVQLAIEGEDTFKVLLFRHPNLHICSSCS
jgi:hypothetical protein